MFLEIEALSIGVGKSIYFLFSRFYILINNSILRVISLLFRKIFYYNSRNVALKSSGKRIQISYNFNGKEYFYLSNKISREPNTFNVICKGEDVTDRFLSFYGPCKDFHGTKEISPKDMGFSDGILILYLSEESKRFSLFENISL